MRTATSGFERLITRSLAIVAIAVAAGAAHSWLRGPLEPKERPQANTQAVQPENPVGPGVDPVGDENVDAGTDENADPVGDDAGDPVEVQPGPGPDPGESAALPDGHISLEDAHTHWTNATAVFIDARAKDEFEAGHIQGALNLSLEMTADANRFSEIRAWLDSQLPIIVYCRGGLCSEAKDVGRLLEGAGYQNILILGAGFPGWQEAGYAVATGPEQ